MFARYHDFMFSYFYFHNTVSRLLKKYRNPSYEDIKGYVACFCYQRTNAFSSFLQIVQKNDFVSAHCILRMLADNVSLFRLIYLEKNINWRMLRHYLYVLDGTEKLKELWLSGFEYEDEEGKAYTEEMADLCQEQIDKLKSLINASPLKEVDNAAFDMIVNNRNWKFKDFSSARKNQYSWKELHRMIEDKDTNDFDFFNFYSQFTHGLSMSNAYYNVNSKSYSMAIDDAIFLMERFDEYIKEFFAEDKEYIMKGLEDPAVKERLRAHADLKSRIRNFVNEELNSRE